MAIIIDEAKMVQLATFGTKLTSSKNSFKDLHSDYYKTTVRIIAINDAIVMGKVHLAEIETAESLDDLFDLIYNVSRPSSFLVEGD